MIKKCFNKFFDGSALGQFLSQKSHDWKAKNTIEKSRIADKNISSS